MCDDTTFINKLNERKYNNSFVKDTDKIIKSQQCTNNFFVILHYDVDF